jgi:hypothetical protein
MAWRLFALFHRSQQTIAAAPPIHAPTPSRQEQDLLVKIDRDRLRLQRGWRFDPHRPRHALARHAALLAKYKAAEAQQFGGVPQLQGFVKKR